ncbi:type IV pilus twitching motility protein PilT [bacterium]|nr:type IV pilus twitching motility protein PilT [bacterium]MBU1598968.1 type IV pilus twitching motility protein PilT [bacterium]
MAKVDDYLKELLDKRGSDLHIRAGEPPILRINGRLVKSQSPSLSSDDTKNLLFEILNEERKNIFAKTRELDVAYTPQGWETRFRVNIYWQQNNVGSAIRAIPLKIPTVEELELPLILKDIALKLRGLVLVTGPTGSGKSTTLAAMVNHINQVRRCNIITIEDPVEFIYKDNLASINQRELGVDTRSFAEALKHVTREDPDIILVGELRDLETIGAAVTAAETGQLVLTTLHTTDAVQTIDRIIDVYPPEQQTQIRAQLSMTIQAVLSQTLLIKADGKGRAVATELMIANTGVRSLIRTGKSHQIYSIIQGGGKFGMHTLDQSLLSLCRRGVVTYAEAIQKTSNPTEFEQRAQRMGVSL